ncbi:fructosamine kinase family protein [Steroidobacter agaridevorans]|uniref:fructosamine kinase family protein n=1 Tax=Steroidobacter agaridevorans TaxID=2695856 RepID=UPI001328D0FF|nr:fructosamine kinase family protein [Steroidobacter agaridevorans]GFE89209.1 fructosamine kinase family protein [Steroidobacter agaridevorans]
MSLAAALSRALGTEVAAGSERSVGGGSINSCARFESALGSLFVKHGDASSLTMFQAEADGLAELAKARAVRVPDVLTVGERDGIAFLVLEWIDLRGAASSSEKRLGELLAAQHRVTREKFGWHRDNTIGSTPQSNQDAADWVEFLREQRLRPQLKLAKSNGAGADLIDCGERLCERLGRFFVDYRPAPSLLHGDLWGGNWGSDPTGQPVLFDPAVYFGDREADLAMTRLFGGFGTSFYSAYRSAWPLDAGAATRVTLYNLYHVLNHFNLFGGGYLRQALGMTQRLLAELA